MEHSIMVDDETSKLFAAMRKRSSALLINFDCPTKFIFKSVYGTIF